MNCRMFMSYKTYAWLKSDSQLVYEIDGKTHYITHEPHHYCQDGVGYLFIDNEYVGAYNLED